MIYAYRPKRKGKTALLVVGGLLFLFLTGLVFAPFLTELRYLLEFMALVSLAAAVTVAGRYLLKNYIYAVEEGPSGLDLTVVEWQAKRRRTVARVALADILEVVRETEETRSALRSRARGMRHYDYCVEPGRRDAVYVFLSENERETAIRFSPDEKMEEILHRSVATQRPERNGNES